MRGDRLETLPSFERHAEDEMTSHASAFLAEVRRRRIVREFSDEPCLGFLNELRGLRMKSPFVGHPAEGADCLAKARSKSRSVNHHWN